MNHKAENEMPSEQPGYCPRCRAQLCWKKHVMAWDSDGNPSKEDTCYDRYCPLCKVFWIDEKEEEE